MTSKLSDINEFENIVLKIVNGSKIRLSDVARLTIGAETDRGFLRANGKNAIGLLHSYHLLSENLYLSQHQ